jgi:hypothetical protein
MKRFAFVVAAVAVVVAGPMVRAQELGAPAQAPPQNVLVSDDKHCKAVRAGDTINYTLTIEDVANARTVNAELQMRPGRKGGHYQTTGLPLPDFQSLNGISLAVQDDKDAKVFHFSFKVPEGIVPGIYHGVGVSVTVNDGDKANGVVRTADLTRRTEDEVRSYCLAVFSGHGTNYPTVVNFKPGAIERK